jgi:hypothetical protein
MHRAIALIAAFAIAGGLVVLLVTRIPQAVKTNPGSRVVRIELLCGPERAVRDGSYRGPDCLTNRPVR